MEPILQEWTCPRCGRSKEAELPQGKTGCEACADPVEPPAGATPGERRTVLGRLRRRYDEAREMASREEPHANLEWLIGSSERPGFEPPDIDVGMARVALLWLDDLVRELDREVPPAAAPCAGEQQRQGAAQGLRTATGDFADAFLKARS